MTIPRFQILPLADHQVAFRIAGRECVRWHFGRQYPRPFFFPLVGPAGESLTRMGHPGDAGHDHHRSVWFAHHSVAGHDFWSEHGRTTIEQRRWLCYQDGEQQAAMAVQLAWLDPERRELLRQDLVAVVREKCGLRSSSAPGEWCLELQSQFTPADKAVAVELGKTNFGFLAVRMAKTVAAYFGDGRIRSSEGQQGEPEIFGRRASWMDYSGSVRADAVEGITYFDHPANPHYPAAWHVREDGWMGASFNRENAYSISAEQPLQLRYLLHVHRGPLDAGRASAIAAEFAHRPACRVIKSTKKHTGHEIEFD